MSASQLFEQVVITCTSCENTYGVAPCTAAVGVTGPDKCFNTPATCQDRENFIATSREDVFCSQNENLLEVGGINAGIPSVANISSLPTTLNIAAASVNQGPLGQRGSVKIVLNDHPYHDRTVDPYWRERDYDPTERSTYWAKWLARNPYHERFPLRVINTDLNGIVGNRTRYYFIEKVEQSARGPVTITAKDVLFGLLDRKYPQVTTGQLIDEIDENDTVFQITNPTQYAASGIIRIENELMTFTRVGSTMTVLRGMYNTDAVAHDAESSIQQCAHLNARVDFVIAFLLISGGVPSAYIDYVGQWQVEADKWLTNYTVDTILTEPEKITTLVGELLEQCSCNIWWDDVNLTIPLKSVRPVDTSTDTIRALNDDENIWKDSVAVKPMPEQRFDQIWFYYGMRDYTKDIDDTNNYAQIRATVAAQAQIDYGTELSPKIKTIFSRWFTAGALGSVVTTSNRILQRVAYTPKSVSFSLHAKDNAVITGDVVELTTRKIIDSFGAKLPTLFQVTSAEESEDGFRINYVAAFFGLLQRTAYITPNDWPNYALATEAQKANGAFLAGSNGLMPNGDPPYLLI